MVFTADYINWQESMNGFTLDCSLDVAVHPAKSSTILLTVPGVDGSLDGYENKYLRIAEAAQRAHGVAVVRMSNPFVSSYFWESNLRRILDYIQDNLEAIAGSMERPSIKVMAHSAGASILAQVAYKYDTITDLLLVNPAEALGGDSIRDGLRKTTANITVVYGEEDPSVTLSKTLQGDGHAVVILEGIDHNFSGKHLNTFIELPERYLLS